MNLDAVWKDEVALSGSVLVPEGETLRIEAGTTIVASRASGVEDRWASQGVRLVVLGRLEVAGTAEAPVFFRGPHLGGIVLLGRGRAFLSGARFEGHHIALECRDLSEASLEACQFQGGRVAAAASGFSRLRLSDVRVDSAAEFGVRLSEESEARLYRCEITRCSVGLRLEGHTQARLVSSRLMGNALGACVDWRSWLAGRSTRWDSNRVALSAGRRAEVALADDAFLDNGLGVESLGRARVKLRRVSFRGHDTAIWGQRKSRLLLSRCVGASNIIGVKLSHEAYARLEEGEFSEHGKSALFIEEGASAEAFGVLLARNPRVAILLGRASLRAARRDWSESADVLSVQPECRLDLAPAFSNPGMSLKDVDGLA